MQTHGITYDEVSSVATSLTAQGMPVTTKSIRAELGTGSQSTITKHLRTWREREAEKIEFDIKDALPKELVFAIAAELKNVALATRKSLESKISLTEKSLDEVTELLSKEEEANQKLTEDLKKVSFEKERLLAKVNELEKQNELLKNTSKEMNRKWQQDREDYSSINSICEYLKKDLERQLEI